MSREAAVLYSSTRGVWELWHRSRPIVESRQRERVVEWATSQGYSLASCR